MIPRGSRSLDLPGLTAVMTCAIALLIGVRAQAGPIGPGDFSGAATLIDFDDLTGGNTVVTGDLITTQYSGLGVVFNNPTLETRANASPIGSGTVLSSKPNVAFIFQGGGTMGPSVPPQELIFSVPVTKVGMNFFTSLSANVTLELFGPGNTLLESQTLVGTNLSGFLEGFIGLEAASLVSVARVTSHGFSGSFNFSIDNVRFEGPGGVAVPEPSTLSAAGLAVLAAIGFARRRRRAA